MKQRPKSTTVARQDERVQYRHFESGDEVRVGGLSGRYVFCYAARDRSGKVYVALTGKKGTLADSSRFIDPERREVVDTDAKFTWKVR